MKDVLSLLAAIAGFVGTALIFYFGVPRAVELDRFNVRISGPDPDGAARLKRAKLWANVGLGLIGFSFALQFASVLAPP